MQTFGFAATETMMHVRGTREAPETRRRFIDTGRGVTSRGE